MKMQRKNRRQRKTALMRKAMRKTAGAKAGTTPRKPPKVCLSEAGCYRSRETNWKTTSIPFWANWARGTSSRAQPKLK